MGKRAAKTDNVKRGIIAILSIILLLTFFMVMLNPVPESTSVEPKPTANVVYHESVLYPDKLLDVLHCVEEPGMIKVELTMGQGRSFKITLKNDYDSNGETKYSYRCEGLKAIVMEA